MGRDPCEECDLALADGLIGEQDCETCKTVGLSGANVTAWNLFLEMLPLLFDGLGGMNAGMIELGCKQYRIPIWRRREMLIKIAAIVAVMREEDGRRRTEG